MESCIDATGFEMEYGFQRGEKVLMGVGGKRRSNLVLEKKLKRRGAIAIELYTLIFSCKSNARIAIAIANIASN